MNFEQASSKKKKRQLPKRKMTWVRSKKGSGIGIPSFTLPTSTHTHIKVEYNERIYVGDEKVTA